jgi:DNA replication protein DnaC
MNRSLVFDLATAAFINKREDALFLGPGGTGKSHLAQAIGQCAIQQGYKVLYRETHILLDELADAVAGGTRKEYMESVATMPLLIIDLCEVVSNVELSAEIPASWRYGMAPLHI